MLLKLTGWIVRTDILYSGSINNTEFLEQLNHHWLLKGGLLYL
jgi:hypothetical protein